MNTTRSIPGTQRLWISLFVISMSVVAFEIELMQFFSIVQWQHFASMIISIALLGFGASGTLLSVYRHAFLKRSHYLIPVFMMTTGVLMALSFPLSRFEFLRLDTFQLFTEQSQVFKLFLNYLLFFLPFFSAALAIGLVFVKNTNRIGYYYFADLMGAGIGGLVAILLMWTLDFKWIIWVLSLLPVLAAMFSIDAPGKDFKKILTLGTGCLVLIMISLFLPKELHPSPYKSISYALKLPESQIEVSTESPYGWLQAVTSPAQRYAPGLSLGAQLEVPPSPVLFNNGNWYAALPVTEKAVSVLDYTTMGVPFHMRQVNSLLQLGAGAGFEVRYALVKGAAHIDAVEPHAQVHELIKTKFATRTDSIFFDNRVQWHVSSMRSFLDRSESKFDLVQLPLMGTFGGSVGLNALEENWSLTQEGLQSIWGRLNDEGMLVLSCWIDMPQKMSVRLGALMANLLETNDVPDPSNHLLVVRSWGTLTFVLSKSSLSQAELSQARAFCDSRKFDLHELTNTRIGEPYNLIQDPYFEQNLVSSMKPNRDSFIDKFPFRISIPSDNRPYFFQFLKLGRWKEQKTLWADSRSAFLELGYLLLWITFAQLLLLSLVLILLPLKKLGAIRSGAWNTLLYFGCLGIGYMFLEIIMIKYFDLYLGHPLYSASLVISVMLISSGLGSRYSERYGLKSRSHTRALLLVVLLACGYSLMLGSFLAHTVGWPPLARILITLILVGIPGFFMGMPFPLGLKKLNAIRSERVPWAWGINGFASVISVSLAVILSVEFGFITVLLLSALAYAVALLSLRSLT